MKGGVLVGRYLGAGRPEVPEEPFVRHEPSAWRHGFLWPCLMGAGYWIASCFSNDFEVVVIEKPLDVCGSVSAVDAAVMVHLCALRNAGDTRFSPLSPWRLLVNYHVAVGRRDGAIHGVGPRCLMAMTSELAVLALITTRRVARVEAGQVGRLDLFSGVIRGTQHPANRPQRFVPSAGSVDR